MYHVWDGEIVIRECVDELIDAYAVKRVFLKYNIKYLDLDVSVDWCFLYEIIIL